MRPALTGVCMLLLTALCAGRAQATPTIQSWRTDSGARVMFVRTTALPIIDVRLTFDAGSARDGDHAGLATLTNGVLLEGTERMDAGEIARRFEQYGARVSNDSARDMATVSVRSLAAADKLDPVVAHFADVLAHPSFPKAAVERVRKQMLVSLREDRQSPSALADRAFARAVFGDHPYASPPDGTVHSVRALERAEVVGFHDRYYVARNAVVAIVGDVTRDRAESIAARITGGLVGGEHASTLPPVKPLDNARTVRIPFDSAQTHVLMGEPSVSRSSPDYFPLYVANHVLGGNGLVSILSGQMREKRGLSYSTYSTVAPAAAGGRFEVGTQVRNAKLDEALDVLKGTITEFHDDGPTAAQLKASKQNITGSFPLNLDSNRDLTGYIAMIGFYDLPLDYLATFRDRIEAVSERDATVALRRHVHPQRMVTVLVGPADVIGAKR